MKNKNIRDCVISAWIGEGGGDEKLEKDIGQNGGRKPKLLLNSIPNISVVLLCIAQLLSHDRHVTINLH